MNPTPSQQSSDTSERDRNTVEQNEKTSDSPERSSGRAVPDSFSWETPEYPYFEKGTRWYTVLALITAGLIAGALALNDPLLAFMIFMGALAVAVFGSQKPKTITVVFEGITISIGDETEYDLSDMESFWIHYEPPDEPELFLHSSRFFSPLIRIPMGDVDPLELRSYLQEFLPEQKEDLPLADRIARMLRF